MISHVNSETGTVQDVDNIGSCLFEQSILFHCDAVQAFGKLPIDVKKNHITSLSASSHKTYGPKGVGLCYINPSVQYEPVIPNATHENGVRQERSIFRVLQLLRLQLKNRTVIMKMN